MKNIIKAVTAVSLLALYPSAASAFPGGAPGNQYYSDLCPMAKGDSVYSVMIPCWAYSIVLLPFSG